VITDTIAPRAQVLAEEKVRVVSVATLIAEAIRRTHEEESISSLFESGEGS
jgi:ribose-phosphate pyrophosphokinase